MLTQKVLLEEDAVVLSRELISSISLFGALSDRQQAIVLGVMTIRNCRAGEHIFSAGDQPSDIFVLINGRVDLVTEEGGVHRIQHAVRQGEMFGETAVIGIQNQICTAIASNDDAQLLVLSSEGLDQIQREDTGLFAILMMNIARDVSRKLHSRQ